MALVKYNGKNVLGIGVKVGFARLLPGINEIADDVLTQMKAHPQFQSRLSAGIVEILQDAVTKDGKRSIDEMLSLMPNINDVKLLKKIIETDGRQQVIKAAQDKLEAIKTPFKGKAEVEDDSHFR
ncbi:MAG: hypothetical protein C5B43_03985 [Verrucomicrobia bacterium]|nr:MAG: hypothetical protein C5B43_03985 [Verrucomicrobiota bacterium]